MLNRQDADPGRIHNLVIDAADCRAVYFEMEEDTMTRRVMAVMIFLASNGYRCIPGEIMGQWTSGDQP